jgi:hypothetical protein
MRTKHLLQKHKRVKDLDWILKNYRVSAIFSISTFPYNERLETNYVDKYKEKKKKEKKKR